MFEVYPESALVRRALWSSASVISLELKRELRNDLLCLLLFSLLMERRGPEAFDFHSINANKNHVERKH